jgi:hypothetical protein
MTTTIAPFQDVAGWERTLYAFLAEKERRSGSRRTVEGYSRMLQHFFGTLGPQLPKTGDFLGFENVRQPERSAVQ